LARFLGGRLQAILHIYSKLNSADALKFSENFTKLKSATDGVNSESVVPEPGRVQFAQMLINLTPNIRNA
jgi:hypothetical protein